MNPKFKKILALTLLSLGALGFLYTQLAPNWNSQEKNKKQKFKVIEPRFVQEGTGAITNNGDTVAQFRLELAETSEERKQGMMYRNTMDPDMGMLFLMPIEDTQAFWMENTYISLDIVYISAAGQVVSIQANAKPMDVTSLPSQGPAKYVLELKGGTCAKMGITPGMNWIWKRL